MSTNTRKVFFVDACPCAGCCATDQAKFWDGKGHMWSYEEQKVRDALVKHLTTSSYHFLEEDLAVDIVNGSSFEFYEETCTERAGKGAGKGESPGPAGSGAEMVPAVKRCRHTIKDVQDEVDNSRALATRIHDSDEDTAPVRKTARKVLSDSLLRSGRGLNSTARVCEQAAQVFKEEATVLTGTKAAIGAQIRMM